MKGNGIVMVTNSKKKFVAEVRKNKQIFLEPFQMWIPIRTEIKGKTAIHPRPNKVSISLNQYVKSNNGYKVEKIKVWHLTQITH